jgi:signal transduction histidine kinase
MQKYWIYQLAGWLGYSAVGITINLTAGGSLGPLLAAHVLMVSSGIAMTHGLRREIRRRRSASTSITQLWPMLLLAGLAISVVLAAFVIGVNIMFDNGQWDLTAIVALWWGMALATGVWIMLYVRFSERRGHAAQEARLTLALREAQLQALESQINPHFLFNALNSIRALVVVDPACAQDMLTRLSNVLRNNLRHRDQHTVTLESELEAVADYLALETVRFADRLRSSVVADDGARACRIPPMIVQTLVENAVKHGVGRTKGPADLSIRATIGSQSLLVAVENTGSLGEPGADRAQLGLRNIRERLQLLYGDRASLNLDEIGDHVVATVAIPVSAAT